jgi:hypothetical protein
MTKKISTLEETIIDFEENFLPIFMSESEFKRTIM